MIGRLSRLVIKSDECSSNIVKSYKIEVPCGINLWNQYSIFRADISLSP